MRFNKTKPRTEAAYSRGVYLAPHAPANIQRLMDGRMFPVTVAGLERALKSLA